MQTSPSWVPCSSPFSRSILSGPISIVQVRVRFVELEDQNYEKLGEANLEIFPIGNNILVKPYPENIFQRVVKSDSGIIVDLGGLAPTYKSHEDGHVHEEESFISVGLVIEVGPETKWVKPDDIIMWTKPSEVPVPFYKQGLRMVNENRIIVTINKDLHERFNGNG